MRKVDADMVREMRRMNRAGMNNREIAEAALTARGLDQYFEEGAIDAISGGHFVDPLFSYMLMVNKLAGTPLSDTCETINLNFVNLESAEDAENYYTYVEGDGFPYNEEEIRNMVKYFKPDMTIDELRSIADAYSVDDVMTRHAE